VPAFAGEGEARVQMRASKKSMQLRKMGRVTKAKLVRELEVATVGGEPTLSPMQLSDSCETVFLRILKKQQLPYYREDGRPQVAPRSWLVRV